MARVCRANLRDLCGQVHLLEEWNAELEETVASLQEEHETQEVIHRERLTQVQVQLEEARRDGDSLKAQDGPDRLQTLEVGAQAEGPWEELHETYPDLQKREASRVHSHPEHPVVNVGVNTMDVRFEKAEYTSQITPKMCLLEWSREEELEQPVYDTVQRPQDRAFQSTVTVAGKKYRSTLWEKSKKFTEQAAAIVCLRILGVPEGHIDKEDQDPVWKRGALDRVEPQVDGDIEVGVYSEMLRKRDEDVKWMEESYKYCVGGGLDVG